MPRLDKTGPEGKGPKTGRGLGNCNKNAIDEIQDGWWRGHFGRRRSGRYRGFWNRRNNQTDQDS